MRCVLFGRLNSGKLIFDLLQHTKIQAGVELTAYFELIEKSKPRAFKFHHAVNQVHDELFLEEISAINFEPDSFDKIYIVGADFEWRQKFLDAGVDYKKISMTYGDVSLCRCPLDEIFIIPKVQPQVPFKKSPAEIYQRYVGETSKAHGRRVRENFFEKYCRGEGLDVGYGGDVIVPGCAGWDFRNGDAQYLPGVEDETFDFVYSSHCLEHMYDVQTL